MCVSNEPIFHLALLLLDRPPSPTMCLVYGVQSLSRVWLFATPWAFAHQAPLSVGFPRQEYWSGLLLPPLHGMVTKRIILESG